MDINSLGSNTYVESPSTSKLNNTLIKDTAKLEDKELMDACREFEAYFIKQMYSAMKSTIDEAEEDSLFGKSNGQKIYEDMLDDEYTTNASKGQGIGIAKMLYQQMSRNQNIKNI
ncbi:MAG: hypothetical protein K0R15_2184 [Clostridiales bacterium]|jgi:flagellar protein FlgJ|nr:hypothetical protein [Clostridiales bacterium]